MRLGRIQSEFESQCDYHSYIIRSPPVIKNIEMEFPTVEGFRNLTSYVPVAQLVEHVTCLSSSMGERKLREIEASSV